MNAHAKEPTPVSSRTQQLGRYRILAQLGQGGMGAIHLAVTAGMDEFEKLVVLKELRPELSLNHELVALFLREVRLAARLNHANIVHTLEAGQVGDRYFMSMEFLDGQTFTQVIARPSPPRLRLQILCETLAGLHYAHELNDYDGTHLDVVHCDVSFGNVFITYDGQVKLVDFGVARVAESLSKSSGFQGKMRYAAPEQLTGGPIDRRADVFAAGVLMWEALANRRYTAGLKSDREIIEARLSGKEPKLTRVLPNVDRELAAICTRALALDPDRRFATAHDFRSALTAYLAKSGPPFEASELAQFMRAEFDSERARVHQLISDSLRRDSSPAVSGTLERAAGHEDVTTVADLSTLIESISSKTIPLVVPQVHRSKHRLLKVFAGTCVLLVGLIALLQGGAADSNAPAALHEPPPAQAAEANAGPTASPAVAASHSITVQPSGSAELRDKAITASAIDSAQTEPSSGSQPEGAGSAEDAVESTTRQKRRRSGARSEPTPPPAHDAERERTHADVAPAGSTRLAAPTRDVFDQRLAPREKPDRSGIDAHNPFK